VQVIFIRKKIKTEVIQHTQVSICRSREILRRMSSDMIRQPQIKKKVAKI
jgi:hypothetical protein